MAEKLYLRRIKTITTHLSLHRYRRVIAVRRIALFNTPRYHRVTFEKQQLQRKALFTTPPRYGCKTTIAA